MALDGFQLGVAHPLGPDFSGYTHTAWSAESLWGIIVYLVLEGLGSDLASIIHSMGEVTQACLLCFLICKVGVPLFEIYGGIKLN